MKVARNWLAPVRLYLIALAGLGAALVQDLLALGHGSGQAVGDYSLRWLALMAGVGAAALAALVGALAWPRRIEAWGARLLRALRPLGAFNGLGALAVWVGYVVVVFDRFEFHFNHPNGYTWFFLIAVGVGSLFAAAALPGEPYLRIFLLTAVAYGVGVKALGYLPDVTHFPFSLGWSEASRYYYAALPYSQRLFGMDIPLSPLHPSRYLLLGLPYLIPESPLWLHRLWQVILWLLMSGLGGVALARRVAGANRVVFWAFVGWSLLFLLQGPVYYHLMVCVILVLWGFNLARPKRTLAVVILASIWAGISRINWVPVPAFLAIALYLLERPVCARPRLWAYVRPGLLWGVVGVLAALASQAAYIPLSGNEDISKFGTSFTSDLLWYRLLPSPTYPMGVFPAGMLVTLPLLTLIVVNWVRGRANWHAIRVAGLAAMMLVLLAGGLVVSTKIGGGSNIHNLDAYMVLVWVVGGYVGFGRFASEIGQAAPPVWRPWAVIAAIAAVAILWNLNVGHPFRKPDFAQAEFDLQKLKTIVQKYGGDGQEILFITQRQLLVFGIVPGVKLIPEYELLMLMEMAISNNQPYLQAFEQDLARHRFALIVADRQHEYMRDPQKDGFAEENNAWVEHISAPLIEYYEREVYLEAEGVDLLVPKGSRR